MNHGSGSVALFRSLDRVIYRVPPQGDHEDNLRIHARPTGTISKPFPAELEASRWCWWFAMPFS